MAQLVLRGLAMEPRSQYGLWHMDCGICILGPKGNSDTSDVDFLIEHR